MVEQAEDYEWSSYRQKVGLDVKWVDSDPTYIGLSKGKDKRMKLYEAYIKQGQREEEKKLISGALQRGQLTGTKRFYDEVEQRIGIRVKQRNQGRPKKITGELNND